MEKNEINGRKPIVLVVEDDQFMANVHQKKLVKEGFDAIITGNGDAALAAARQKKPDIILLDLIMPVKDGFETLRELKDDPALKEVKVIILSNLSQEEDTQKVLEMGAVDYLVKANVSFKQIVDLIKEHLGIKN